MNVMNMVNLEVLSENIGMYAKKVGRIAARPVLLLYYVLQSKDTPQKDKLLILSTLAYIVLPTDFLNAKRIPILGWFDEAASLSVAYERVCKNITPAIEAKVEEMLDRWFSEYTYCEIIED